MAIRRRQRIEPMSHFNLTSLMDVTFILLIAFMIVAPSLKHGIELDLPEINADTLPARNEKTLTVVIQAKRPEEDQERIFLDVEGRSERVTLTDLRARLEALQGGGRKINVTVEPDRRVPSERLLEVIYTLQQAGIENIGIPTTPPRERR
ncbi:MAG: protein TolR [Candidatus Sumerlaeia bacterium]